MPSSSSLPRRAPRARGAHSEGHTQRGAHTLPMQRTCSAHCTRSTVVSPSRPMPPTGCRSLQTRASVQRWSPPSSSPRATSAAPRAPDSSWTGTRTTLTTLPHPHHSCRARHSCQLLPLSPVLRPLPLLPLLSPLPLLSFLTLASTRAAYLPLVITTTVVLPLVLLLPHLLYHSCHAYRPLLWPPRRHSCPDP